MKSTLRSRRTWSEVVPSSRGCLVKTRPRPGGAGTARASAGGRPGPAHRRGVGWCGSSPASEWASNGRIPQLRRGVCCGLGPNRSQGRPAATSSWPPAAGGRPRAAARARARGSPRPAPWASTSSARPSAGRTSSTRSQRVRSSGPGTPTSTRRRGPPEPVPGSLADQQHGVLGGGGRGRAGGRSRVASVSAGTSYAPRRADEPHLALDAGEPEDALVGAVAGRSPTRYQPAGRPDHPPRLDVAGQRRVRAGAPVRRTRSRSRSHTGEPALLEVRAPPR